MEELNSVYRIKLAEKLFGWRPHPTQQSWLLDESKIKVAACGRRWGKTEAQAVDVATFAVSRAESRQMIVAPTYDQSKLAFDTVERMLMSSNYTSGQTKCTRTPYPRIQFGKSVIMARTADEYGHNLRGHSADRVIVDEAAFVKDAVVDEVIGPMLADRDGQLILISTPFGKNHFYRAFVRGEQERGSGRSAAYRFPSWENPHISREYIEAQRDALSKRQFGVEYEAEFIDDQNSVFSWADIEAAMSLWSDRTESDGWRVAGIDWARYSDYTAVVAVDTSQSPHTVLGIDRFNKVTWQSQMERMVDFLQKHRVNAVLADQTSIGDPLLEQLRNAVWSGRELDVDIQGHVFTNSSKREVIDNLALAAWSAKAAPVSTDRFLSCGRRRRQADIW